VDFELGFHFPPKALTQHKVFACNFYMRRPISDR